MVGRSGSRVGGEGEEEEEGVKGAKMGGERVRRGVVDVGPWSDPPIYPALLSTKPAITAGFVDREKPLAPADPPLATICPFAVYVCPCCVGK